MIRLKGGDNKEANYMGDKMTQALGGGPKKKLWGQDKYTYDKPETVAVSIRSQGEQAQLTEVHDIYKKHDGLLNPKDELKSSHTNDDSDSDDLFGDEDTELERIRQARLTQLQKQGGIIQKFKNLGHGRYNHIKEDEFLPCVTESKYAVVHFYHTEFERCRIIDKHLEALSQKYLPVKFARMDAEKAPFFVEKLKIIMLPTIVLFKDGVAVDRVVGFEELGGHDDFTTKELETRMKKKGCLRSLTREGKEVEGDEEDELARQRAAAIRSSSHNKHLENMARGPPKDDRSRIHQRKREIIKQMNEKRQRERERVLKAPKKKEFNLDPTVESVSTKKSRQQLAFERSVAAAKTGVVKKTRRGPDRKGLAEEDIVKTNVTPKFETEMRDGESMVSFLNRLNREKNEFIKQTAKPLKAVSEKKKAYMKERKAKLAQKKIDKEYDRLKDREFEGRPEYIPFGEVADRPPSFDDITLPTNKKAAARSSNLAILNEALARANADVKAKYAIAEDEEEEEDNEDAPKRVSKEERAKMLAEARAKQRKAEVEKIRLQAQMAYRELKSRRGHKGMSALAVHGETLRQGAQSAMQNLQNVDRR